MSPHNNIFAILFIWEQRKCSARQGLKTEVFAEVDLKKRTCTCVLGDKRFEGKVFGCNKYQIFGYPCVHAIALCHKLGLDPLDFVDYRLTTAALREMLTAAGNIPRRFSIQDDIEEMTSPLAVLPPNYRNASSRGRKRTRRFKSSSAKEQGLKGGKGKGKAKSSALWFSSLTHTEPVS